KAFTPHPARNSKQSKTPRSVAFFSTFLRELILLRNLSIK
ncbi:hypothetical protein HMPREF9536_05771, partial [Escherichia coli MS 84-1]